jgi:hypothetical protein
MVYSTWQYALIIHIVTVLIIAVLRVRAENRLVQAAAGARATD